LFGSLYLDWSAQKVGFSLFNLKILRSSMKKKKKPEKKKKVKKKKLNFDVLWQEKDTMVKSGKVVMSSLGNLFKRSRVDRFFLDARIGTPDPALTGILYGGLLSISYPLQTFLPNTSINIYPDFEKETLRSNMELSLKTRIFNVVWIFLKVLFLLPKMRLIRFFRKLKKYEEVKDGESSQGSD